MKKIVYILTLLCSLQLLNAQNNMGHHTDNYAGIYSLGFNPAEIVDSRYRFHMNIVSVGATMSNNYLGIKRDALFSDRDAAFDDPNFSDNYLVERLNGNDKKIYQNLEIGYLPSFMINFGKKRENALAVNLRLRTNTNVAGVSEEVATESFNELLIEEFYDQGFKNENFTLQTAVWHEIGFSYGRQIFNTGKHFLSAAGTFKLTHGIGSTYFFSDNLDVTFLSDSSIAIDNSDIQFGYNSLFTEEILGSENISFASFDPKMGMGGDVGVVYEWRPKVDDYNYEMDGDPNFKDPRKEKYKLKVGLGIVDMGYTRYARNELVLDKIYADNPFIDIEATFENAFEDFDQTGFQGFADTLASIFVAEKSDKDGYSMALPMRINAYADYRIWKGFYANFTASIAPAFKKNPHKTNSISEFSLTPRFESRWFSFYLPVSANSHGNMHLGTGMRLGPLTFGTNDITPLFAKNEIYDANVYMNLNIPIFKKLRDKDRDHVSNKRDLCKKDKGSWEAHGCPDRDLDGITDDKDKCPDTPGIAKFEGCPDTDEDGIEDAKDECPKIAGIEEFKGCPDSDEDGIKDTEDDCPEVAGIAEFNGCPDTDKDGIKDDEDDCPEVPGLVENNGCPEKDKDNDGILDENDDCPEIAGPKENNGCPYLDTDGDGVYDKDDECVRTPGLVELKGCPKMEKEVQEALDLAFKNLEFETGSSIIKKSSYNSLENLSTILKENPTFKLRIEGHTDSQGSEENNLILSEKRANAVKTFLQNYDGINAKRFLVVGYGETKPIADNSTATGRAENRRVEMEIVVD